MLISFGRKEPDLPETPANIPFDDLDEATIVSFIVRLWKDKTVSHEKESLWRGHITCVPDGPRQYFANISEIAGLIRTHLESE
jgi:hypothetical protein